MGDDTEQTNDDLQKSLAAGHARRETGEQPVALDDGAPASGPKSDADLIQYQLAAKYVRPRDRVFDLGCGPGVGLQFLRHNSAGLHFIGIDSSLRSISDHSVDLILAFNAIDESSNPGPLLQDIRRVLVPGGRLIISASSRMTRDELASLLGSQFLVEDLYQRNSDGLATGSGDSRLQQTSWTSTVQEPGQSWIATAIRDPLVDGRAVPYRETVFANLEPAEHLSTQYIRWYLNPWIVHSMVHVGYRVKSRSLLATLAKRLVESSPIESADYGAALCILAYQQLERPTDVQALEIVDRRIGAYLKIESDNPHVLRWRISLTSVLAQLQLKAGSVDAARQLFQTCAAMDPFSFSTHLATKTADAFFWWGWLAVTHNDIDGAQRAWSEGVAFGERLLNRPMNEILINPAYPNIFDHGDGMREFVLAMENITKCVNGLHLIGRLREGMAVDWRNVHMTFRERGDRLEHDVIQTRLDLDIVSKDLVDRTRHLDDCRNELITRTADVDKARDELTQRTRELDETRRDLIERTRQLERTNQELIDRTADLDLARSELVARTADLDVSRAELIQRTADLDTTRQELIGRTAELDKTRQELIGRTAELDATRQELIERTNEVNAARQDLDAARQDLAAARKRGRFWRFRLVD